MVSPSQPKPAVIHKTSSSVTALIGANAMSRSGAMITLSGPERKKDVLDHSGKTDLRGREEKLWNTEKAFDRKDRGARPQRSRRKAAETTTKIVMCFSPRSSRCFPGDLCGQRLLLTHRPSQAVRLFSRRNLSDNFQRLQIQHHDLVVRADSYEGACTIGSDQDSCRSAAQIELLHFFARRRVHHHQANAAACRAQT